MERCDRMVSSAIQRFSSTVPRRRTFVILTPTSTGNSSILEPETLLGYSKVRARFGDSAVLLELSK